MQGYTFIVIQEDNFPLSKFATGIHEDYFGQNRYW